MSNKLWAEEAGYFQKILSREVAGEIKAIDVLEPKEYCAVCNREIETAILASYFSVKNMFFLCTAQTLHGKGGQEEW
jgi:hypothetical protein